MNEKCKYPTFTFYCDMMMVFMVYSLSLWILARLSLPCNNNLYASNCCSDVQPIRVAGGRLVKLAELSLLIQCAGDIS